MRTSASDWNAEMCNRLLSIMEKYPLGYEEAVGLLEVIGKLTAKGITPSVIEKQLETSFWWVKIG